MKLLSLGIQKHKVMDIQLEKLQLIEWLAHLNDTKVVEEIKALKKIADKNLFSRYTEADMVGRAQRSMDDIENGRTTKLADFKTEIESWKQSRNLK